ncbi:MAG: hypothetical protein J7K15_10330 [Deltaproteobacteria bacterium]|nr:hypothetical protein [Deltaproteobacteria bacterium]
MKWHYAFIVGFLVARVLENELRDYLNGLFSVLNWEACSDPDEVLLSFFLSVLEDWAGVDVS